MRLGALPRIAARSLLLAALLAIAGCGGGHSTTSSTSSSAGIHSASTIVLSSPTFAPGAAIPRRYTCDGADTALPLRWSGVPHTAHELVMVMRDQDALGGNFIHWALARIPPTTTALDPADLPPGAVEGQNSFGSTGYRGPCPPRGAPHHYVITLSALAVASGASSGFSAAQLRTPTVGSATLTGTYGRS